MSSAKDDVRGLLERLPDDVTLEDIQHHIYVLEKLARSAEAAKKGDVLTQEEGDREISTWLDGYEESNSMGDNGTPLRKVDVLAIIHEMPDPIDSEDLVDRIYLQAQIEKAEEDVRAGRILTHEEVVRLTDVWHA